MIMKIPPLRLVSNKKGLSYKYRSAFYTSVRKNSFIDIHFFEDYMFQLRAVKQSFTLYSFSAKSCRRRRSAESPLLCTLREGFPP